jgi:L-aminopeptidase/D-esterase-like protein
MGCSQTLARARLVLFGAMLAAVCALRATADEQNFKPVVDDVAVTLTFDWPALRIGTAEYEEGPTGVTVFLFPHRALAAIDVRGGAPGTVNSDYLRLGYDVPELDAVVFAGGSWYGLETVTAVATALKDDGIRNGDLSTDNVALTTGSIIYDLGARRLNEIYPDKRIAQAAYRGARSGIFPLGAYGAGRFARTGAYFGCNAYSGEGGAYRKLGPIRIAAFAVVNALGVVTTRDGSIAACYRDPDWPKDVRVSDLMRHVPLRGWRALPTNADKRNTTISLVVTNERLSPDELKRLAVQVHTSMARAVQPFSTEDDGDVLYAVSTEEVSGKGALTSPDLGVVASELMWDAILASVPSQPALPKGVPRFAVTPDELQKDTGTYDFSPFVSVRVSTEGGKLFAEATGARDAYSITRKRRTELVPIGPRKFDVPGRYPLVLSFDQSGQLIVNPGHWAQFGKRRSERVSPPARRQ